MGIARGERPNRRRAAEKRDELAARYHEKYPAVFIDECPGSLRLRTSGSMPTLRSRDCVGIEPQSIKFVSGPGRHLVPGGYQVSESDH